MPPNDSTGQKPDDGSQNKDVSNSADTTDEAEDETDETTIVATGDGDLRFERTAADPPDDPESLLDELAEHVAISQYDEGQVVARMADWMPHTLEVESP